ncbi:MAG: hypothetical protein LBE82_12935 [Chitinophagaceae bacterium]|nr:hypothetical protein [Chitinophagaceae bacterium]
MNKNSKVKNKKNAIRYSTVEILILDEKIKLKTSESSYRKEYSVSIALKTEENRWFIESITKFM